MQCAPQSNLGALDLTMIIAYFIVVLAVGFWSMFGVNRGTINGYFLAGRFMTWLPVGASLFATNIGSEHFIGLAGSGAADGIGVGAFELNALIIVQLLGWVFLPVYIASGVSTLPEFMSKRFGGQRIRVYLAVLSLILYVVTKMSVNIYSGSLFVQELLGWNLWLSIFIILGLTALCTITGGLAAVIYMDTFQCFLMVGGAAVLAGMAFNEVGGYTGMWEQYLMSKASSTPWNATCGIASPKSLAMLREPTDPDYPWPGFLLGQTPASIWYWAADQMMVQRALASKSLSHAQGATLFAGLLKITPLFLIVMPGMISRILCPGIMLAGMMAALMSDLTSLFNSAATLFTLDIWHRARKSATQNEMLIVGRIWVLVMVGLAILWVPIIGEKQGGQLYIYIQSIAAYLAPPIAAVYLLAILWGRTNETGAFYGLMVGFVVGCCRMIMEFIYTAPKCGEADTRPIFLQLHYMYFALCLFLITALTTVFISTATKPLPEWRLIRTTFWTRFSTDDRLDEASREKGDTKPDENGDTHEMKHLSDDQSDNKAMLAKNEDVSVTIVQPTIREKCKSGMLWLCGFQTVTDEEKRKFEKHMFVITSLHQTKAEKTLLNIGLVLILLLAVGLFVYYSAFNAAVHTG